MQSQAAGARSEQARIDDTESSSSGAAATWAFLMSKPLRFRLSLPTTKNPAPAQRPHNNSSRVRRQLPSPLLHSFALALAALLPAPTTPKKQKNAHDITEITKLAPTLLPTRHTAQIQTPRRASPTCQPSSRSARPRQSSRRGRWHSHRAQIGPTASSARSERQGAAGWSGKVVSARTACTATAGAAGLAEGLGS